MAVTHSANGHSCYHFPPFKQLFQCSIAMLSALLPTWNAVVEWFIFCSRSINALRQVDHISNNSEIIITNHRLYQFTNNFSIKSLMIISSPICIVRSDMWVWHVAFGWTVKLFVHKRRRAKRAMYLQLVPKTWVPIITQKVSRQLVVREVSFWS